MMQINILVWNYRGIVNHETQRALVNMVQAKNPSLIFLSETLAQPSLLDSIRADLGFAGCINYPCEDDCRGVALLWKADTLVRLKTMALIILTLKLENLVHKKSGGSLAFMALHIVVRGFELLIKTLAVNPCSLPWLMAGDFNEIMSNREKSGGEPRAMAPINLFRQTMVDYDLQDMGFVGSLYTWSNKFTKEMLDRSFHSPQWRGWYPCSRVVTLPPIESDHSPLLIEVSGEKRVFWKAPSRFRFKEMWHGHSNCLKIVQKGWSRPLSGNGMLQVGMKIGQTCQDLMQWHQNVFNAQKGEMRVIQEKLNDLMRQPFSLDQYEEQKNMHARLNVLLTQQETYWRQRSKPLWLKEGDMNSAFFHRKASNRKQRNRIKGIINFDGTWCTDPTTIHDVVLQYFNEMFTSEGIDDEALNSIVNVV